jgi:nicotinate-nucleotide adenylyltransferase
LALAKAAKRQFKLDQIIFIPSGIPPHKDLSEVIDKEERFHLIKLAIQGIQGYSLSRLELDRPGPSYAVDTFKKLRRKYGDKTKLFYIMGLDSLNELSLWHKPEELFKLCEFIVATRPGAKPLYHNLALDDKTSASDIRKRIKVGKSVSLLVPKIVEDYIKRKGLYL